MSSLNVQLALDRANLFLTYSQYTRHINQVFPLLSLSLRYVTLAPGVLANLSGIRTFRVFRALRTISAVKGWLSILKASMVMFYK